jgi:hypothetical protein
MEEEAGVNADQVHAGVDDQHRPAVGAVRCGRDMAARVQGDAAGPVRSRARYRTLTNRRIIGVPELILLQVFLHGSTFDRINHKNLYNIL